MLKPKWHHQSNEEPNLLGPVPKNVWREVYQGRWTELSRVQKVEFVVEVVFCAVFSSAVILGYLYNHNAAGFLVIFTVIGITLALFFFLLTRSIR